MAPVAILAEVMDKEPTARWLLLCGLTIGIVSAVATRITRWSLLLCIPLAALALDGLTSELRDPHVGPAILREAGANYVIVGWAAALCPLFGCLIGFFGSRRAVNQKLFIWTAIALAYVMPIAAYLWAAAEERTLAKQYGWVCGTPMLGLVGTALFQASLLCLAVLTVRGRSIVGRFRSRSHLLGAFGELCLISTPLSVGIWFFVSVVS